MAIERNTGRISRYNNNAFEIKDSTQDYTYLIYPLGSMDFRVKRGSDETRVYESSNSSIDALGAIQYCRDQILNTVPGGAVKFALGSYPISATISLIGGTHAYQKYFSLGNGSPFNPYAEIKAKGDFPVFTLDGQTAAINGITLEGINLTHDTAGYSSGLVRMIDQAVENTFEKIGFYDNGRFAGDVFKFEILNNAAIKAQYENRISKCISRGFDNFLSLNQQCNTSTVGGFMSTLLVESCFAMNSKRILKVAGISGAQILDIHFRDMMFQYSASNSVGAGGAIFDYDSVVSCWNQKHTDCMIWDITAPGINYANVGTSVELELKGCNPSVRIAGSGAYANKVKTNEYYLNSLQPYAVGTIVPTYVGDGTRIGDGVLAGCSVLQTPSISNDSTSPYLTFTSGGTQGTNTGTRKGGSPFRMEQRPYLEYLGAPNNTSLARLYIGFHSNVALGDTDTLLATTDTGILVGWRSSDTNICIFYNNGGGNPMTVIDTGLPRTTTMFKIGLLLEPTSFTWIVATPDGGKCSAPVSGGAVPGQSTVMSLSLQAQNTTTNPINHNMRWAKLLLRNL